MIYRSKTEFLDRAALVLDGDRIQFLDREKFRTQAVDDVIETMILGEDAEVLAFAFQVMRQAAMEFKVYPHSIQAIYEARAKDDLTYFSVPAINLRTLTYDLARAVFRSVRKINAGTFIFEIARSEIGYTNQSPQLYAANVILAAVKEGYSGPVFIQGDHFQVNLKKFKADPDKEIMTLKNLISDAVAAGFYNIDIDSSTLVDLSYEDVGEQQRLNYEICAELTDYIRSIEPEGITVSVGGEIGEVGGHNSNPEELRAFMNGFNRMIEGKTGLSKISIQTGTSHGGVVLPDGSIAKVKIDFDTLHELSRIAMAELGWEGPFSTVLPRCPKTHSITLPRGSVPRFIWPPSSRTSSTIKCRPPCWRKSMPGSMPIWPGSARKDRRTSSSFTRHAKRLWAPLKKRFFPCLPTYGQGFRWRWRRSSISFSTS